MDLSVAKCPVRPVNWVGVYLHTYKYIKRGIADSECFLTQKTFEFIFGVLFSFWNGKQTWGTHKNIWCNWSGLIGQNPETLWNELFLVTLCANNQNKYYIYGSVRREILDINI